MSSDDARHTTRTRGLPVPVGRTARLLRIGGMTGAVLGAAALSGLGALARGQRPALRGTVLTPQTAQRLARDLGRMRGAAMKLGQLLSMDAGHLLPPEMSAILSVLRAEAPPMPPRQLREVLDRAWGRGWYARFERFDLHPFASASIGQVHRARTRDGRDLAIKVQYPGVRDSIDSDLDNVARLLRLPGLVPPGLDLAPLLAEARRQLRAEADYEQEAENLGAYRKALGPDEGFMVPELDAGRSTAEVLAMLYCPGDPLESVATTSQPERDRVAERLISLCLRELFEFGLMQTDPNLGNYRYDRASGRIVLLDFGAVMRIDPRMVEAYRALSRATLRDERAAIRAALGQVGYVGPGMPEDQVAAIERLYRKAAAPLIQDAPFDFAGSGLPERLRGDALALGLRRDLVHVPPPATMFLHRKIAGLYLLAERLRARVALRPLLLRHAQAAQDEGQHEGRQVHRNLVGADDRQDSQNHGVG